jgi:hypothetical protein
MCASYGHVCDESRVQLVNNGHVCGVRIVFVSPCNIDDQLSMRQSFICCRMLLHV